MTKFNIIQYPDYKNPLKQAFGGRYESVYVIFHPFIRYPDEIQQKFTIASQEETLQKHKELKEKEFQKWKASLVKPSDQDDFRYGIPVTWKEAAECFNLEYPEEVHNVLGGCFGALNSKYVDQQAIERVTCELYNQKLNAWVPDADGFVPMLCPAFRGAFLHSGAEVLHLETVLDGTASFTRESLQQNPDAFLEIASELDSEEGCIYPSSEEFQFHGVWDSHFTLFYGSEELVSQVVNEYNLEGFYCDESTRVSWAVFKTEEAYQEAKASWPDDEVEDEKVPILTVLKLLCIGFFKQAISVFWNNQKTEDTRRHPCACCGNYTFWDDDIYSYEICDVCRWEVDPVQIKDPDYPEGANNCSLNEARDNYKKLGVSSPEKIKNVRKPFPEEFPENNKE